MALPVVLIATWNDGLIAITGAHPIHELQGQPVRSLVPDGAGSALAIVDGHTLRQRTATGSWSTIAESDRAFAGDDVIVSASENPFSTQGGIYRRPLEGLH